jgi:3-dehydroquinate dehydratase
VSLLQVREADIDIVELRVDGVDLGEDVLGELGEELLELYFVTRGSGVGIELVSRY